MPSTKPFISFLFGNLSFTGQQQHAAQATTRRHSGGANQRLASHANSGNNATTSSNSRASSPNGFYSNHHHQQQQQQQKSATGSIEIPGNSNSMNDRRNSASSLPGSGEKWWIGGRSSDGNERYYRIQPLSRNKSFDRISLDQLSI